MPVESRDSAKRLETATPKKSRRKPSKQVKTPVEAGTEQPVTADAPVPMRVQMHDLWTMRLAQQEKFAAEADARTAQQRAATERVTRLYLLAKLDPKGHVLECEKREKQAKAEAEAASKRAEKAENKVLLAQKRMEDTIGRPVKNLGIDLDTGEVILPPQE